MISMLVQAADVICVTCAGAGDPRLSNFRFRKVLETPHCWQEKSCYCLTLQLYLRMPFAKRTCCPAPFMSD